MTQKNYSKSLSSFIIIIFLKKHHNGLRPMACSLPAIADEIACFHKMLKHPQNLENQTLAWELSKIEIILIIIIIISSSSSTTITITITITIIIIIIIIIILIIILATKFHHRHHHFRMCNSIKF